jgi:flagellar basal-body rod modification protein FlgD
MEEVTALAPTTDSFETSTTTLEQAGLDRDAFLSIFLTQLQFQDPLNPQDSSELSAQLATFSQLEQSIVQADQLREVNERLESLIEATNRTQAGPTLDPVALIGRQIEVGGNLFGLAAAGAGEGSPFFPGNYTLSFSNGSPRLQAPGQDPVELTFFPLAELPNGELAVDPDANPVFFSTGSSYGFQVETSGANDERTSLATTTSGTVTSVRIVDGFPVLVVAGQDIDPTQILRIQ